MIPERYNIINVINVRHRSNFAYVTCTIPNYMDVLKTIEIGQSITTSKSFELQFPDFSTLLMLIYYPKGQYDYGRASNNERAYFKILSSERSDQILMNIKIMTQTSHSQSKSYPLKDASKFIASDMKKSWAGPFEIDTIKDIKTKDSLTIKCQFELIHIENNDKFNSKRSLSEVNFPISWNESKTVAKKNRAETPQVESKNMAEKNSKITESKFKFQEPPRNLKFFPDERLAEEFKAERLSEEHQRTERNLLFTPGERAALKEKLNYKAVPEAESKNTAEKNTLTGYERLSKQNHRNLIFTPDERAEFKEQYNPRKLLPARLLIRKKTENIITAFFKPKAISTPSSSRLSLQKETENFAPKTLKSSQCLQVSDIFSNDGMGEEVKQKEHADHDEMMSATNPAQEEWDHDQDQSLNKRISYFEGLSKGKE